MKTYNLISNKYQTTGKIILEEYDTQEEAQTALDAIAERKEKNGFNVDYLDNGTVEVTHDDLAEVTAYYIEEVYENAEYSEDDDFMAL